MKWSQTASWMVAVVLAMSAGSAWAAGVPAGALTYAGTVTDASGAALSGQQVKVSVYASATDDGSAALCASKPVTSDEFGSFVALLDKCDATVHSQTELYTEVVVGKTNATTLPRTRITPAAYALEAGLAAGASGALASTIASFAQQISDLGKKIASVLTLQDLAPLNAGLQAVQADVAALKAAPKVSAQVVNVELGTGTMIETQAGTLTAQFGFWIYGQYSQYSDKPVLKIDGQAVGQLAVPEGVYVGNGGYTRWMQGAVAVQVTAGKHFIELGGLGTCKCMTSPAGTPAGCPILFTVLP